MVSSCWERARSCLDAKYAEYVVYGNMIMLCEGLDVQASMENCATCGRSAERMGAVARTA